MNRKIFIILFLLFFILKGFSQESQIIKKIVTGGAHVKNKNHDEPKDGVGSLGNTYSNTDCGLNFVSISHTLNTRNLPARQDSIISEVQPAPYVISGLPICATIVKAYVWWSTSGSTPTGSVTVRNPSGDSATFNATDIGIGPDKCWNYIGYTGTYSFRADVTPIITGTLNGTYYLSGLPTGLPDDVDGATLFVIIKKLMLLIKGPL